MSAAKTALRRVVFAPLHPIVLKPVLTLGRVAGLLPRRATGAAASTRRILVVNLTTFLGDGVMMMPFLGELRATYPFAQIDLITTAALSSLFTPIPALARTHYLPAPTSSLAIWATYSRMLQMLRLVRTMPDRAAFDLCFLPRWGTDPGMSAWIALFAGIADVRGYDPRVDTYGHAPVPGVRHILTTAVTGGNHLPESMRELRLLEVSADTGPMDYKAEAKTIIAPLQRLHQTIDAPALFERLGLDASLPFVTISPGASSPSRRWPAERFAHLATRLYAATGMRSIIVGGPADASIGATISHEAPGAVHDLTGQTSLAELACLLAGAALLVANDSGPAHLGAGVGTPTLVISACPAGSLVEHAGSPARVAPIGPSVHVLQPAGHYLCADSCSHSEPHCILGLTVDEVFSCSYTALAKEDRANPAL